jgi:hypothetical protein
MPLAQRKNYAFERNQRARAKAAKREAKRQAKAAVKARKAEAESNSGSSDEPVSEVAGPEDHERDETAD